MTQTDSQTSSSPSRVIRQSNVVPSLNPVALWTERHFLTTIL